MRPHYILAICFVTCGCGPGANPSEESAVDSAPAQTAQPKAMPSKITNQFGMTFRLFEVDSTRADHQDSFPRASYYLQETELAWEQHSAFRKAAFGDGTYESINWHYNSGYPSEWREVFHYAEALSKFDADFDYRLPSRQEFEFACKNGYDQTCPGAGAKSTIDTEDETRPNKFGIKGLMNYDVECASEPGWFFGKSDDQKASDCRCHQFIKGNPDADDDLNELIVGRFVIVVADSGATKKGD